MAFSLFVGIQRKGEDPPSMCMHLLIEVELNLFLSLGSHWHLHAHYYPPLLRSASVRSSDYFKMEGNLKIIYSFLE